MSDKERLAQWMIQRGYATGHGDTLEDLLQELDWQIADGWNRALMNGVKTEREQCAKVCYDKAWEFKDQAMAAPTKGKGQRLNDAAIAWYDAYEAIRARSK